jgi:hypothetical protein
MYCQYVGVIQRGPEFVTAGTLNKGTSYINVHYIFNCYTVSGIICTSNSCSFSGDKGAHFERTSTVNFNLYM